MNRSLIEKALKVRQPENWVSEMSSSRLVRPRRRPKNLPGQGREAAVMLLLFESKDGPIETVLTRRKETLQHHPGQISLPGGRREPDESLQQTGCREVEEEIGVPRQTIQVVGTLNSVYVPPSDFTITPYVGWLEPNPEFVLQAEEVAELIRVPFGTFMNRNNRRRSSVPSDAQDREVPFFAIDQGEVWGATAIIIDDFVQRLEKVNLA